MKNSLSNYIPVFEKRVDYIKKRIKEELQKNKNDRNRKLLKHLFAEIKKLKKTVKEVKKEHAKKCPHCGKEIENEL